MSERNEPQVLSYDDEAAQMAEQMLAKGGGAGALPESRRQAEGGFTEDAGGTLIDAAAKGGDTEKSQKVTSHQTNEPGRQNAGAYTGTAITDEPGREAAHGSADGNLDTDADDMARKRKSGQVGVGGGLKAKQNVAESGDGSTRSRKPGQVGIKGRASEGFGKSDDGDEDDKDGDKDKPPWKKGARLSPEPAIKGCGVKKGDGEDDDEDEDEEGEEKSLVDADDLLKSLDTLEAIADGASIPVERDRRAELAEGFALGSLSKAEIAELHDLTKSDPELLEDVPAETFEKSYQETFAADPTLSEGYDVSPFLERQSQLLAASLDDMREKMAKSLEGGQENVRSFNRALAKSLRGMAQLSRSQGELIKSLVDRLEVVENQPMPRRGHSSIRSLSKSMPGEVMGDEQQGPSRNQVFDALEYMAKSADFAPCGIKLTDAVAQFEGSGQIPASLMRDVEKVIRSRGNGVR